MKKFRDKGTVNNKNSDKIILDKDNKLAKFLKNKFLKFIILSEFFIKRPFNY